MASLAELMCVEIDSFDMGIYEPFSNLVSEKGSFDSSFFMGFDSHYTSFISNQITSSKYYYGHHYDVGAISSNVILPIPSFFEKKSLTLDMQGLILNVEPIHNFVKSARESVSSSIPFII